MSMISGAEGHAQALRQRDLAKHDAQSEAGFGEGDATKQKSVKKKMPLAEEGKAFNE